MKLEFRLLSVIFLIVIETQNVITSTGSYIGSIDNVVLPETGLPVTVSCPVLTSVDSVSWFMYDSDTSAINVFNGIDYAISTTGRYYCQATEQRGIYRSNTFTVYRVGFADSFSVNPQSLSVDGAACRFAFECQIDTFAVNQSDLNRARIEWEAAFSNAPDDYQIQDRQNVYNPLPGYSILVIDTNDLSIDNFRDIYRCMAVFILQDGSDVVVTSEPGRLIIDEDASSGYNGDIFLLSPSNKTVTEMDRAVFVCVPANPIFEAVWQSDFPFTTTGPNNYYLLVEDVDQTRSISCSINNSTASSTLTVQEIPMITSTLPNVSSVQEGTSLTLQCQVAMTIPTPSIIWLANGTIVQTSTENYTITGSEGIYQCLVEASFIISTNSVGLPPTYSFISTTFVDVFSRVTIITAPEDLAVAVGQDVTFICVANGHRPPTIEWFQTNNNSLMFRDSESETLMNGTVISTLFISDVMDNDFGNYSCVASNDFSSERANFTVSLAAPGSAPQNVSAELLSLGTVNVSWSPPPTSLQYGSITEYLIEYFNLAETDVTNTNFTTDLYITLTGLSSNTTYMIRVAAINEAGTSPFANVTTAIPPPVEDSEIILPNRTVPQDRINPNSIIVDLPTPPQLYSHVWVVAIRLSSQNSPILSVDTNEEYPTQDSFESYATAGDDEPYIVAEISQQNYPTTFALGDNSATFTISDFPELYVNGPLIEGRFYSIFVRFFSSLPAATRNKRNVVGERQYVVFATTPFLSAVSTANTVSFSQSVFDADEEGEIVQIVLTLSSSLPNNIIVQVVSSNINATEDDYMSGPYSVTILAGDTQGLLDIAIINDNIVEDTEIFNLTINILSLPEGIFIGDPGSAVVNILDSDVAVLSFNEALYRTDEDTGSIQPMLVLSKLLLNDIIVQVNNIDINATGGVDYNPGQYFITIPAGMANASFNISISPDNLLEGNEAFLLIIDETSVTTVVILDNSSLVVIIDDDPIMLSFSQPSYRINEDDGLVQPVLIFSNPSSNDFTIQIISNSITTSRTDYDPGPYDIRISTGITELLFNISVAIDDIVELEEEFELVIDGMSLPPMVTAAEPTIVIIVDNDTATVNFVQSTYPVNETSESVQIDMVLSNPSSTNFLVQVTSSDIQATGDVDYNAGLYNVTFSAGDVRMVFDISINDDNLLEITEAFNLTFHVVSMTNRILSDNIYQATVFIIDNDDIAVNFSQAVYTYLENNILAQPEVVFSNPSSFDIAVQVIITDITAVGVNNTECAVFNSENDYMMGLYNVIVPANVTVRVIDIPICDDRVLEEEESFNVSIFSNSFPDRVSSGVVDQATVIIEDDDPITISFNQSTYYVNEKSEMVELIAILSNPSAIDITVQIIGNDGTAENGSDFLIVPYNITFPAGSIYNIISITIQDDNVFEIDEMFNILLLTFPSSIPVSATNGTTIIIVDDDPVTISFSQPVYSIGENNGAVEIELMFSNPSSIDITIEVITNEINATGNVDYDAGPHSILFTAGDTIKSFNISIFDNNTYEALESFYVIINPPSFVLLGDPHQAITTIIDDDVVVISFNQLTYIVNEKDRLAQPELVLNNPSLFDIVLQVRDISDGLSDDYISGPYEAVFLSGRTNYVLNITIDDDNLLEPTESFNLTIQILSGDATIGNLDHTVISIVDNDAITVQFTQQMYVIAEKSGVAQPELIFSNPSYEDIDVTISNMDIDATANADYNFSEPHIVTVLAGETRAVFNVLINIDNENEGTEKFSLLISSANLHPNVSIGNVNTTTISIVDDIVLISFAQSAYTINENVGTLEVEVTVSEPFNVDIAVHITTTGISAKGDDFRCDGCNRTLVAGMRSVSFNINISDDNILELDEDFMLSDISPFVPSSSGIRVITGSPENTIVVITDNDFVIVNFGLSTYAADEGSKNVEVDIRFSNPSSTDITVQVTNRDISANSRDNDYSPGPYTLTFPPETVTSLFNISITDDNVLEGNEIFNLTVHVTDTLIVSRVSTGNPSQVTVTILDNDPIDVTFEQPTYSVNEELMIVQPVLTFSNPSATDIIVQVINTDVSTSGADYTSGPYHVTFPAGRTRAVLDISVTNDNILEVNESFNLAVISAALPSNVASEDQTIVTITDNDTLTIDFSDTMYFVNEDNVSVQAKLILSDPSSRDITVQVDAINNNATGGIDYDAGPHIVIVPAGETELTFSVPVHNDTILERTESFTLSINSRLFETDRISIGNTNSALVIINDTSGLLTVEFSSDTFEHAESAMQFPITLSLGRGTSAFDISVTVLLLDQSPVSAEGDGVDYDSTSIIATFRAGTTSAVIDVPITEDNVLEQWETFALNFNIPTSVNDVVITGRLTEAVGVIIDTTTATISFNQSTYAVVEDNVIFQVALSFSNVATFDVNVQINSIDIESAIENVDYISTPISVIISTGETSVIFNASTIADNTLESNETYNLAITVNPVSLINTNISINTGSTSVIIIDDDPINVTFSRSTYYTMEEDKFLQFALEFTNPSAFDIKITITASDLTATGIGTNADFDDGPHDVEFPINTTMVLFNIEITDDDILEIDEDFVLSIDSTQLISQVYLGNISQASALIIDDDPITVTFSQQMYTFSEESEEARPNLRFSNPSSFDITIQVMITDGTAAGVNTTDCDTRNPNNDYTMGLYDVTFSAMMTVSPISISVCNDIVLEDNEVFHLMIVSGSLHDNVTNGNPSQASATIIDNDPIDITFDQSINYANESNGVLNGRADVLAVLSNPSSTDITVLVESNEINATSGGVDFTFAPRSITFPASDTEFTINVEINDDNIFELGNETFSLTLSSVQSPQSLPITIVNGVTTVVILDDDRIKVNFSQPIYYVDENSMNLMVTLMFSNPSSTEISINVFSTPINVTRDFDYDDGPYNTVFPDGTTSASFNIRIFDNHTFEKSETFNITINPPSYVLQGDPSQVKVIILDHQDIVLERSFESVVLLEGTRVTLSCLPTRFPTAVPLNWTRNEIMISEDTSGLTFSPGGLNHNLIIESPVAADSGNYHCIAAPTVNQTISVTVLEACQGEFAGGLLWPTSERSSSRLVTQRCSALHPSFRSGVMISRQCGETGDWSPVSIQDCTMFSDSNPLVIVYFTVTASDTDEANRQSMAENVINQVDSQVNILKNETITRNVFIPESNQVALVISFILQDKTAPNDIVNNVESALPQFDADPSFGVLAFQPSASCLCDDTTNTDINNGLLTVCIGPSTPPCNDNNRCNTPTYNGDGTVCGLDTDWDGFPDVKLDCIIDRPSCEQDLCPEIFSAIAVDTQSGTFCNITDTNTTTSTVTGGCEPEIDPMWSIDWPATESGGNATQKCPGGSEAVGFTSRLCISNNWEDPDVSDCSTVEQIRLGEQAMELESIVENILSTTNRVLTVMFDPQAVSDLARDLGNITNSTLVPRDTTSTVETLDILVNVARDTSDLPDTTTTIVVDVAEDATTVLDNLLDERNDISFQESLQEVDTRTVGERVLDSAEGVALLLVTTLDNETASRNITRDNIFMSAERPTMDAINAVIFPPADINTNNITTPSIELPEETVRHILVEEEGDLAIVGFVAINFEQRLPTDEGDSIATPVISVQTTSADSRRRMSLGNNSIILTANLTMSTNQSITNPRCAFWDFARNNQTGGFSEEGIMISNVSNERIQCVSNHLTSFAILVNTQTDSSSTESSTALSIVTYVGCGISIFCVIIVIIVFIIFRKKIFNQLQHFIHFNLSVALLIGLVIFVSGIETASDSRDGCLTVAILLHYFFMAVFCWMMCEGILLLILLYFVFYKGFFKTWKFFTIIGWGAPIPIVAISAGISHEHYGSNGRCWISSTDGAIWGFIGPMLLIILINAIFLTTTIVKVFKSRRSQLSTDRKSLMKSVMSSAKAAVILLPVFGLTWVFGLLAVNEDTVVFAWIFTVINSLQGLFILVFYVLKNEKFIKMVKGCVNESFSSMTTSSTYKGGTLQTSTGRRYTRSGSFNPTTTLSRSIEQPSLQHRSLDMSIEYRNDSAEESDLGERTDSAEENLSTEGNISAERNKPAERNVSTKRKVSVKSNEPVERYTSHRMSHVVYGFDDLPEQ